MKKLKILLIVFFLFLGRLQADAEIVQISAELLKQQMDSQDVFVINVLNRNTFKDCSIQGSVHIGADRLQQYARNMLKKGCWTCDKKIVVYCASTDCPLGRYAWKILRALEFNNVSLLSGGMRDWKQKGYSVKGDARAEYLKG